MSHIIITIRHNSIQDLKQCQQEFLSLYPLVCFPLYWLTLTSSGWLTLTAALGNSSLICYQLSSPSQKRHISFPVVPTKVLGLNLIGLGEVTCPSLNQSRVARGMRCSGQTWPLCSHDWRQFDLDTDGEWRWAVWKREIKLLITEGIPKCWGGINNK